MPFTLRNRFASNKIESEEKKDKKYLDIAERYGHVSKNIFCIAMCIGCDVKTRPSGKCICCAYLFVCLLLLSHWLGLVCENGFELVRVRMHMNLIKTAHSNQLHTFITPDDMLQSIFIELMVGAVRRFSMCHCCHSNLTEQLYHNSCVRFLFFFFHFWN